MDKKKLLRSLTIGRGTILSPHIEAYQRRGKFPKEWQITIRNEKPNDGHFHPSSDSFTPPNLLWRQKKGLTIYPKTSAALRRTFDVGHFWHGYLESMLIEMGFVKPENTERYVTHELVNQAGYKAIAAGTADLVDVQIPGEGSWLVDIKTMNKEEFKRGAHEYTMLKWRAQVSCYMDWFDADKAFILAVCKDSPHQFNEYQIQKDDALLREIYGRWILVQQCLEQNIEPPSTDYKPDPLLLNPGDSVLDLEEAKKVKEEEE